MKPAASSVLHSARHPRDMAGAEVEAFLGMLANERRVAAPTHNQAVKNVGAVQTDHFQDCLTPSDIWDLAL